jgi:hypothetical protein
VIRPEDEPLMVKFHKTLSDRSVHLRYFGLVSLERRIMHERLRRVCFIDYDREIALVADLKNRDGTHQIPIGWEDFLGRKVDIVTVNSLHPLMRERVLQESEAI